MKSKESLFIKKQIESLDLIYGHYLDKSINLKSNMFRCVHMIDIDTSEKDINNNGYTETYACKGICIEISERDIDEKLENELINSLNLSHLLINYKDGTTVEYKLPFTIGKKINQYQINKIDSSDDDIPTILIIVSEYGEDAIWR